MPPDSERDLALALDMLISARDAIFFVRDIDFQGFSESRLHQNACIRSLEIIGEAATKISISYKSSSDQLPWKQMISLCNRLIHGYNEIQLEIVWSIIKADLPVLIEQLTPLVPEE